jgi:hypothetical protein
VPIDSEAIPSKETVELDEVLVTQRVYEGDLMTML